MLFFICSCKLFENHQLYNDPIAYYDIGVAKLSSREELDNHMTCVYELKVDKNKSHEL